MRIAGYTEPTSGNTDLDAVREALQKGPLVTTLSVYTDFLLYKSGVYTHTTGQVEGGHAISIVGYDDTKQAFIIRNSWGEDWGENGFAYISYNDISGVGQETYQFQVPQYDGFVSVRNPSNRTIEAGTFSAYVVSSFHNLQKIDVTVVDAQERAVSTQTCSSGTHCSFNFATNAWADGQYQIYATATYGGKTATSLRQFFYVENTKSQMTLSFDAQGFDIAQPLSGRVVFNIHAQTGAAPLSAVTLIAKKNGQMAYSRGTNIALPEMTLGWRTISVANGTYDIYLVGKQTVGAQTQTVESNHYTVTVSNTDSAKL